MMLSHSIRNIGRCTAVHSLALQQINKLNCLTPISISARYHQNFHRNDETINRRTGFLNETYSSSPQLHKTIHSHAALYLKYSNLLEQKVKGEEKQIAPDDNDDGRDKTLDALEEGKKLGLFARFKKMAKDYWYVLIPVHVVTSGVWLGAFYYTSVR